MGDNLILRTVRRLTGLNQKNVPSFYDREQFDEHVFNKNASYSSGQSPKNSAIEDFIKFRTEHFMTEIRSSYSDAENFLLLINSAALAGIFALFDQLQLKGFTSYHIVTILMFFLSLMFLGLSKWSRIIHANFLSGEFYKATIRYYSGKIDAFDLVTSEYRSRGARSIRGLWAILSFVCFGLGWGSLYLLIANVYNKPSQSDDVSFALLGEFLQRLGALF
jgi:hypothetical protein